MLNYKKIYKIQGWFYLTIIIIITLFDLAIIINFMSFNTSLIMNLFLYFLFIAMEFKHLYFLSIISYCFIIMSTYIVLLLN